MYKEYQICAKCVMDTSDPDIKFDQKGICNHCHTRDGEIKNKVFSGADGKNR